MQNYAAQFCVFAVTSSVNWTLLENLVVDRLLGSSILTIREAAWLTDNTYQYEDVVRMMGEITATLHGNLKVQCALPALVSSPVRILWVLNKGPIHTGSNTANKWSQVPF